MHGQWKCTDGQRVLSKSGWMMKVTECLYMDVCISHNDVGDPVCWQRVIYICVC